ncbi:hypothetical protein [Burkholderia anthina]|uniref:hypothetical protein n=1 Tax=Burkholderia anthina TaxID=179879 RepID=UPI00158C2B24|nr:hypothetical protein [Burkholderia anthina]
MLNDEPARRHTPAREVRETIEALFGRHAAAYGEWCGYATCGAIAAPRVSVCRPFGQVDWRAMDADH